MPENLETLSLEQQRRLLHDLRVHQIELEMQDNELHQTQARLEASRERYFDLYDLAPVGYLTISEQGVVLEANLTAESLLGMARSALATQPISHFVLPGDQDSCNLHLRRLFETGSPQVCELRMLRKDGSHFWACMEATLAEEPDGSRVCRAVLSDIDERKRTEEALGASRQVLEGIINAIPVRVFWKDKDLVYLGCNAAFAHDAGLADPKDLIGKDDFQMGWRDQAESYRGDDRQVIESGCSRLLIEEPQTTPEGSIITLLTSKIPLRNPEGEISGVLGTYMDITERKQAEERVRTSEAQLSNALQMVRAGDWEYDVGRDLFTFNDNFYRVLRTTADEVGGYQMSSADYARRFCHPDDAAVVGNETRMAIESTDPNYERQFEHRVLFPNGEVGYVTVRFFVVKGPQGSTVKTYGVNQDITERKRAEESLKESEERYRDLVENASDLICTHDLKGVMLSVNAAAARASDFQPEELVGRDLRDLLPRDRRQEFEAYLEALVRDGGATGIIRVVTRTGDVRYWEYRNRLRTEGVEAPVVRGVARDVTEQVVAKRALSKSEEKYRTILENTEEGYYEVDIAGNLTFFNDSLCRLLGYSKDELTGMNDRQFTDAENAKKLYQAFSAVYRTGEPTRGLDWEVRRKDGTKRTIEASVSLRNDASGKPLGFRGMIRDVTERKQGEEALKASEKRVRSVLETMSLIGVMLDAEGKITLCNDFLLALTGWARDEVQGQSWFDLFLPPEIRLEIKEEVFLKTISTGEMPVHYQNEVVTRSGERRLVAWNNTSLRDHSGAVVGVASIGEDITDRKRAEDALERSDRVQGILNNLLRLSLESLDLAAMLQGALDFVLAIPWLELSPKGAIFLAEGDALALKAHKGMAASLLTSCATVSYGQCLCGRAAATGEVVFADHVDGRHETSYEGMLPHGHYCVPIASGGEVVGVMCLYVKDGHEPPRPAEREVLTAVASVLAGIIQRKRAEEALEQSQAQLLQAQKMEAVGRLAGGVAHDFNNILQAMLSLATVLRLKASSPELAKTVAEIEAHIKRGAGLTQQLLLFSRRQVAENKRLDVGELTGGAVVLLRRLIPENIRLAVETTPERLWVEGDVGQLQQVLMNLAVNAKDAMPGGGTLTVHSRRMDNEVVVEVIDTGHGMDEETRAHLFEPFFTTKEPGRGTGLGLSVVLGIVEQHRGRIEVESVPGKGSLFRVSLPVARAPDEAAREPSGETELPRGDGARVLVVEDEEGARNGLVELLEFLGYEVTALGSGEEAGVLPAEPAPDLLLTDLMLPGIDGAGLAAGLCDRWPHMKTVLMSGYTEDEAVRRGVGDGNVCFLQKPFDLTALARALRAALEVTAPS
ncbi:MAG: PAS domain S-box protein [Acidobacteria bacterium]|nr:PAS domain S-box protein [Acidobacteriota bacterium]